MLLNSHLIRRAVVGTIGAGAVAGATLLTVAPSALADPPPNCTAADLAGVAAGVSAATSTYLFTHPDVNDFFTSLQGIPRDKQRTHVNDYLNGNPEAQADLQGIRQPLVDLRTRCGNANAPSAQ
ncbi:MAG: heme-binding protein [Mycobacterium sp.]